jgi:flavin-dependent dehydrogenase
VGLEHRNQWFFSALGETTHIAKLVQPAPPTGSAAVSSAHSGRLDRPAGSRWFAVGDSAQSLDPLAGQGMVHALRGGQLAASEIIDSHGAGESTSKDYLRWLDDEWKSFQISRIAIYGSERRWASSRFWQRRHEAVAPI